MRRVMVLAVLLAVGLEVLAQEKIVLASDEQTRITVPEHWTELELNDAAELQVGSEADETYLIVLNERKDDLYGYNLDKHSRVTLGRLLSSVAFPTVSGPKSVTIGGSDAIQYEIRGAIESRKIVYLHTTVDGPKHYSQILAWSLHSRADAARPQLLRAIQSFREVEE